MRIGRNDYRTWEAILLVLAFLTFGVSSFFYFSEYPLRTWLLGWEPEIRLDPVGYLEFSVGDIKRKSATSPVFERLSRQDRLYNFDTLVTGDESGATLTFDDGSTIDLGPNTMIKLEFASTLSLGGIARAATVEVMAGQVTGKAGAQAKGDIVIKSKADLVRLTRGTEKSLLAGAPSLMPLRPSDRRDWEAKQAELSRMSEQDKSAAQRLAELKREKEAMDEAEKKALANKFVVELLEPKPDDVLKLDDGTKDLVKRLTFKWKVNPPDAEVRFTLKKQSQGSGRIVYEELVSRVISGTDGIGTFEAELEQPGRYEWELKGVEDRIETKDTWARFILDPTFRGIDVQEPLIAGKPVTSNQYAGSSLAQFDITLRWEPFPTARFYQVDIFKDMQSRIPVLEKRVGEPKYILNKDKVFSGQVFYRISAELKSGFIATSGHVNFRFDFLPPLPVVPRDKVVLTRADLAKEDNKILFTWQKTNYTEAYEIEVSQSPGFDRVIQKRKTQENFILIDALPPGNYYWRLRSMGKGETSSPPSPVRSFSVAR